MKVLIAGASGNVGTACINYFCQQENTQVYGISRTTPHVHNYDNFTFYQLNLDDYYDIKPMATWLGGQLNLVIIAQGTQQKLIIGKDALELGINIIRNNLLSAWSLTHTLIELDLLAQNSLIVYSSSIQATQPRAGRGPYAMAKAGIEALTKVVAVEQSPKVRTACLRMGQLSKQMKGIIFGPEQVKEIEDAVFTKLPTPKEIAQFCHNLYNMPGITGTIIDVDSGHHLSVWPK
jgi:NAD(P)-dependent dehydrogenase (short-subunit alcohol dehydrogenase family)